MSKLELLINGVKITIETSDGLKEIEPLTPKEELIMEPAGSNKVISGKSYCILCGTETKPQRKYCEICAAKRKKIILSHAREVKKDNSEYLKQLSKRKEGSDFLERRFNDVSKGNADLME